MVNPPDCGSGHLSSILNIVPLEKIYEKLDFIFFNVIGDGEATQRITTFPIQK